MADDRRTEMNETKNAKRRDRRLATVLRSAPIPSAPDDLLSKLLDQIPETIPETKRRGVWHPAWVGVLAAAAALIWWATPSSNPENPRPRMSPNRALSRSHSQPLRVPYPEGPPRVAQVRPKHAAPAPPKVVPVPHIQRLVKAPIPQNAPTEPMKLVVAVGHATPDTIGVAKAAAWTQDDQGRWTQTQWTLTEGEGQNMQAMTLSSENGPVGSVSVTPTQTKNESSESRP